MLKYQEIINTLSLEQKLSLIADFASQGELTFDEHGFKCVSMATMEDSDAGKAYPSAENLINSFNSELFGKVADAITVRAKKDGVTLLGVPGAKVKTTPYADGFTEDPCLALDFAMQFAGTSERAGIVTFASKPYLDKEQVRAADVVYNERAVKEYLLKPTEALIKKGNGIISLGKVPSAPKYEKANEDLDQLIKNKARLIIRENATAEQTLMNACGGQELSLGGSVTALKEAYEKYKEYRKSFEAGNIALKDVETACRSGNALSPEMIDQAVEKILDFSSACSSACRKAGAEAIDKNLSVKAVEESIVLLKNERRVLPLGRRFRVALVGSLAKEGGEASFKGFIEKQGSNRLFVYSGYSDGYSLGLKKDGNAIKQATMLASKADALVVAVGFDHEQSEIAKRNGTASLPAGQVALLQALKKTGKRIIAVVYGSVYPDMQFDRYCDAVMLAPMQGNGAAEGLYNVLAGRVSPSGRLANTCYTNTDAVQKELRQYKNAGRNEVGVFFGYRRYDTAQINEKYPFGFGLTYSKFTYSGIKVRGATVYVTVKNTGKFPAHEVVQLYIGKEDSSIIRPKKELKAFKKVYLAPGKSIRLSFDLATVDLKVFDPTTKSIVSESGYYEVYVGGSINDAKKCGRFMINGVKLESDGKKFSDYFQSVSNIHDGGYHLDVPMKIPKESAEKRRKFSYVALAVVICLDIIYIYLDYIGWLPKHFAMYIAVVAITVLPLLSSWILTVRKKDFINKYMEVSKKMKMENREKLNIDELMDEVPYTQLFEEAFKEEEIEFDEEQQQAETAKEEIVAKVDVFDKDFTMPVLCGELITYLSERGIILDPVSARSLTAGFASSRLLILKADEKDLVDSFVTLLGKYLGGGSVITPFEKIRANGNNLLTYRREDDVIAMTDVASFITDKEIPEENMRLVAITDALCDSLQPCFTHVFKYMDSPEKPMQIYIRTDEIDGHFDMPENVWFMITLADGEKLTDIPKYILDTACVVDLSIRAPKEESATKVSRRKKKEVEVEEEIATTVESFEQAVAEETTESLEEVKETAVEAIVETSNENVEATIQEQAEPLETVVVAEEKAEAQVEVIAEEQVEEVLEESSEDEGKTPVKKLDFNQFVKMVNNAGRDCQLDENLWKRVDKLEDYVATCREYRIENKLWQRMEKYVSAYLAAGGEPEEALDSVMAHHVIYGMLPAVAEGKGKNDDKFTHTIENIFGEGHAPHSVRAVKSTGLNV